MKYSLRWKGFPRSIDGWVQFKKPLNLFQVIRQGKNEEDHGDQLGKKTGRSRGSKNPSFQLRGWISEDDIRFSHFQE
jgi:hypothetical protein